MNTTRRVNNRKNKNKKNKTKARKNDNHSINNKNNDYCDLDAALNSCNIVYLLSLDDEVDRINLFIDEFNSQKESWDRNQITRIAYNEESLCRGKAKFPFSFKNIFDYYNKHGLFINFTLHKTNIKYWENPDFSTVITKSSMNIISVDTKDNSYIEIPLNNTENCNVFILSFSGLNGIIAFTHPFTLLFMRTVRNIDNKLTVID